ncbi:PspA-associated protein PspAA [Aestuariimicrobium ganziense]|uniref:PspA-associated protein PspAA n=1 Tax=Aestuariimicrobium ganziense TaxID=2773677 RepID=UPI0019445619|nr:hypothetical protein [Aestuariimicrobium ganziense]
MIVRIIGEGQWTIDPADLPELNDLDDRIEAALTDSDQETLTSVLTELLDEVRSRGTQVPDDVLADSDLILPDSAVSLQQMQEFLDARESDDGLIPDDVV